MEKLLLIDGNAILHRSYHALPPLPDETGKPMGAVYGFFSILIKLFSDLKPTYIAVAFDRPTPTFRKKLLPTYQSQRPEIDKDLSEQIAKVHDMLGEAGIPVFEKDGYEADDVIGTIAKKSSDISHQSSDKKIDQVIIATGDRDILQLVEDDRVKVFMPTKGLSEGKLYGEADVMERMGVFPKHITDLKALTGDSSDNYSGVAGIGPKTAVDLLKRFGSVEALYKHKGDWGDKGNSGKGISEGVIEKLKAGEKDAMLCKDLATIRTDAPLGKIELPAFETLDTLRIRAMLERFPSLVKRIRGEVVEKKTDKRNKEDKKETKSNENAGEQLSLV